MNFQKPKRKQIEKLLELLVRKDDRLFEPFCEALITAGDQQEVLEKYFQKHRVCMLCAILLCICATVISCIEFVTFQQLYCRYYVIYTVGHKKEPTVCNFVKTDFNVVFFTARF